MCLIITNYLNVYGDATKSEFICLTSSMRYYLTGSKCHRFLVLRRIGFERYGNEVNSRWRLNLDFKSSKLREEGNAGENL